MNNYYRKRIKRWNGWNHREIRALCFLYPKRFSMRDIIVGIAMYGRTEAKRSPEEVLRMARKLGLKRDQGRPKDTRLIADYTHRPAMYRPMTQPILDLIKHTHSRGKKITSSRK